MAGNRPKNCLTGIGNSKIQFSSGFTKACNTFQILSPVAFCCNAGMFKNNFNKSLWSQLQEI